MATSIFLSHPLFHFPPLSSKHHKIPTPKQTSAILAYHPTIKYIKKPFFNSHFPFPYKPRKEIWSISVGRTQIDDKDEILVGEDSAEFQLSKQKISSWVYFTGILGVVLYVLNVIWIDNSTGFGKSFIDAVSTISDSHEVDIYCLFSLVNSVCIFYFFFFFSELGLEILLLVLFFTWF